MKLSYTPRQLEPITISKRGAPKGNQNAAKPASQKAHKIQGYISLRQLEILIALEEKMSMYSAKKRLRSYVVGTAIEILNMLVETMPVFMLGDEEMNNYLIAQDGNDWTVVDIQTGTVYSVTPSDDQLEFSMLASGDHSRWSGSTGSQLATQFAKMVMARKNDSLGQAFNQAVSSMAEALQ